MNNYKIFKDVLQISFLRIKPGVEEDLLKDLKAEIDLWHAQQIAEGIFVGGVFGIYDLAVINFDHFLFPHLSLRFNMQSKFAKDALSRTNFSCYTYSDLFKNSEGKPLDLINQLNNHNYSFLLYKINPLYYKASHGNSFIEKELFRELKQSSDTYKNTETSVWGTYGWHEVMMIHIGNDIATHSKRAKNLRYWRFCPKTGMIYKFRDLKETHENNKQDLCDKINYTLPLIYDSIMIPGIRDLYYDITNKTSINKESIPIELTDSNSQKDDPYIIQTNVQLVPGCQFLAASQLESKKKNFRDRLLFKFGIGNNNLVCNFRIDRNNSYSEFISFYRWLRQRKWLSSTQTEIMTTSEKQFFDPSMFDDDSSCFTKDEIQNVKFIDNSYLIKLFIKKVSKYNSKIFSQLEDFLNKKQFKEEEINELSVGDSLPLFRLAHLINVLNGHLREQNKRECVKEICLMVSHLLNIIKTEYQEDCLYTGRYINEFTGFIEDVLLEESVGGYYSFPATEVIGFADLSIGGTRRIRKAKTSIPKDLILQVFKNIKNNENNSTIIDSFASWINLTEPENSITTQDSSEIGSSKIQKAIINLPLLFRARHRDLFEYIYPYGFNVPMPSLFSVWQIYRLFHETGHLYWSTFLSKYLNNKELPRYRSEVGPYKSPAEQKDRNIDEETFCDIFEYLIGYERDLDLFLDATAYRISYLIGREEIKFVLVSDFIPRAAIVWWVEQYIQGKQITELTSQSIINGFIDPFQQRILKYSQIKYSQINKKSENLFAENYEFLMNSFNKQKLFLLRDIEKRIQKRNQMLDLFIDLLGGIKLFRSYNINDIFFNDIYSTICKNLNSGSILDSEIKNELEIGDLITPSRIVRALLREYLDQTDSQANIKNLRFFRKNFKRNISAQLSLIHWLNDISLEGN